MNKTININLAGIIFHVDEDAYQHFNNYLDAVRNQFGNAEERDEIVGDIEARIAELLQQKLNDNKQVINRADIDSVIAVMGSPEDYIVDEEESTSTNDRGNAGKDDDSFNYARPKRLFRNPDDKILGGVSGGLAAYFGMDPIWIRLIWIALFFGWGTGFLLYIILWIVMPEAKTTAQKLQMRGEPININNIEKTVKEEMKDVKERFNKYRKSDGTKKTGSAIRNTIEEIVTAVLTVLKYVFVFAFKFIGVILMIAGVIILIVVFSLFLGNDFSVNGALLDWTGISGYLTAIMPTVGQKVLLSTGVIMLALAPIIGAILLGMRILFNYRTQNKFVGGSLVVVSIVGTIFIFVALTTLGVGFKEEATYTEVIEIGAEHKSYALRVSEFIDDVRPYELDWTVTETAHLINYVDFNVQKTDAEEPFLELEMESRGKSRLEARKRAKNYDYYTEQRDSIIKLADYFTVPIDEKFRAQNLQVVLFLPVGYSVYLDETAIDVIHDIKNVTNTFDGDMVEHTWLMTQNGLVCTDCDNEADNKWRNEEEWESFEEDFEEEAEEYDHEASIREAERKIEEARRELERLKKEENK